MLSSGAADVQTNDLSCDKLVVTGVITRYRLVIVFVLIMLAVGGVIAKTDNVSRHVRYIRTYVDCNVLGNCWEGMYEVGDNIDQSYTEMVFVEEFRLHLGSLFTLLETYAGDGLAKYTAQNEQQVTIGVTYANSTLHVLRFALQQQARRYFEEIDLKGLLLGIRKMQVRVQLGCSEIMSSVALIFNYLTHSQAMVSVNFRIEFEPVQQNVKDLTTMRILCQCLAITLIMSYVHNIISSITIRDSNITHNKQQTKWLISLIFLNTVIVFSEKLTALCAILQLLPMLQPQSTPALSSSPLSLTPSSMYNFNRNIRHAFPLVASILLQMYIFLNGFIFYSMLMYPGDYFDDYAKAILSYAYQLFQVGTYEIFNEIKNAGQVAYWLYVVLYFYVNFVGNSLIPGLFCALIQKKVVEKDITSYVAGLVKEAVCPSCSSAAISSHEQLQIHVSTPQLIPLISGNSIGAKGAKWKIYLEGEESKMDHKKLFGKIQNRVVKIKALSAKLKNITTKNSYQIFLQDTDKKITDLLQKMFQKGLHS